MYHVKQTELTLWTVGIDTADGWNPVEDFDSPEDAQTRAAQMNGLPDPNDDLRRIAGSLASIAKSLAQIAAAVTPASTDEDDPHPAYLNTANAFPEY